MLKILSFIILLTLCTINTSFSQQGFGTDVTGILAAPIGKNAQPYDIGFGGLAAFYYDIEDKIRLAITLGFIRLGVNNDELNKSLSDAGQGSVNIDGSMSAIPVLVSFRIITPGPDARFYGLLEAGIYTYWSKAKGTYFPGNEEVPIDKSEFRSEPGFTVGGGLLFPLSENLNADLNVRYTFIRDSEYINLGSTAIETSQLLMFGLGLNWFFPL
jgi:opacity protein-like surface antigen